MEKSCNSENENQIFSKKNKPLDWYKKWTEHRVLNILVWHVKNNHVKITLKLKFDFFSKEYTDHYNEWSFEVEDDITKGYLVTCTMQHLKKY